MEFHSFRTFQLTSRVNVLSARARMRMPAPCTVLLIARHFEHRENESTKVQKPLHMIQQCIVSWLTICKCKNHQLYSH